MNLKNIPMDMLLAEIRRRARGNTAAAAAAGEWNLPQLVQIVAEVFDISADALRGELRTRRIVTARRQFCVAARQSTKCTLEEIGEAIRRDHSSVCHCVRRHDDRLESDPEYAKAWAVLMPRVLHASRRSSRQVNSGDKPSPAA